MPANVETMMYAGERPWHGLGIDVQKEQTSENAIKAAGLDWNVSLKDIFFINSKNEYTQFKGKKATVRDIDDNYLGVVGDRYRVIQNSEAFDFFDELVGEKLAIYHTAGSLDHGRKIWILAKLPNEIKVTKSDIVEKFILLTNSHDGSMATRVFYTPVRVVCQNTLNAALRDFNNKDGCSVRHTQNYSAKLSEAREILGLAENYYIKMGEIFQEMVKTGFSEKDMKNFAVEMFPSKEEASTRTENIRSKVAELFEKGMGQKEVKGTVWAAYNAVTEFADHHRSTRLTEGRSDAEARLDSAWFGSGSMIKQKAFELLTVKVAKNAKLTA